MVNVYAPEIVTRKRFEIDVRGQIMARKTDSVSSGLSLKLL